MTQSNTSALVDSISAHVKAELAPLVNAIDQDGFYPAAYLRGLGQLGGFSAGLAPEHAGLGLGLSTQIQITTTVARECGSTAFLVWCQSSCASYFAHTSNEAVRTRYLKSVASGELLAGTGMSNAVKHLAGIEKMHLTATRDADGYIINGALPWVSNVGEDHLVVVAVAVGDEGYAMLPVLCATEGLSLHACPEFAGLEGTQTLNLRFKNVRVAAADALAHPDEFPDYIARIKPSFVLGQTGMGFGLVQGCLKIIRDSNITTAHVNVFLDDQGSDLALELEELQDQATTLAQQVSTGQASPLAILKLRARVSELALQAANSAMLHAGAKGYLMRHPAQRRLREAVFVAIVTPALKHLRKEIQSMELANATRSGNTATTDANQPQSQAA